MRKTILLFFISILLISTASALVEFNNIGGDFTIEYPSGWSYVENNDGTEQTFTSKTGRASVMVVVVPSTGRTLKQIVDNRKLYLNELDLYPFDQKSVTINGVRGIKWTFIEYYDQEEDKNEQVVLLSGNKYYIITAWAQNTDYPFYSDDIDQIINSIRIETYAESTTTEHEVVVPASSFETYTDEEKKFRIKYPSSWNSFDIYDDSYYGDSYTHISDPDSNTGVYVSVFPADGMTLNENVEGFIRSWNELDVYPYNERDITINKLKAYEWEFIYTNPDTYTVWKEKEIILLFDDKVYTIIGFSERGEYSQYSNILDQIINSFEIIQPDTTKTTIPVGTATPVATVVKPRSSASVDLYGVKTDVEKGEDIKLILSVVSRIDKPPITVQVILKPPSGMSVTSTEYSTSGAGQYSAVYEIKEPGKTKEIAVTLKGNQVGEFDVKSETIYYFGGNISTSETVIKILRIKVRDVGETNGGGKQDDDDPSGIGGLIAILVIIFTGYVIFNKLKNKSTKSKKSTTEVKSKTIGEPNLQAPAEIQEEEPVKPKPPIEKKESSFEIEKRKQHKILPPENLDVDTKSYLSSGVNVAVSTLDAEITRAESDALQIESEIKGIEDILGKLGTRFVNKDISEQTYNNLKNKYQRKVSELKNKVANLESGATRKKEIRSFIQEKGTYYYT